MNFAVLGNITFQTLWSPSRLERERGYTYAEQKLVENKPDLQWIGDELETLALEMRFDVRFVNPGTEIATLRAAGDAHQAMALVYGNGFHAGYWVITKIHTAYETMSDQGDLVAINVTVDLKEWVPDTSPDAAPVNPFTPIAIVPGQPIIQPITGGGGDTGIPIPIIGGQGGDDGDQPILSPIPLTSSTNIPLLPTQTGLTAVLSNPPANPVPPTLDYTSYSADSIVRAEGSS